MGLFGNIAPLLKKALDQSKQSPAPVAKPMQPVGRGLMGGAMGRMMPAIRQAITNQQTPGYAPPAGSSGVIANAVRQAVDNQPIRTILPASPTVPTQMPSMKKGGSSQKYTHGGKINLGACSVSTHEKSKKSPNW